MKGFGTRTLESIASLNKTLEQSKDFSNTIGFHSSQIKESNQFEDKQEFKKKKVSKKIKRTKMKRRKSQSAKKDKQKKRRISEKKSIERDRSKRFNNTSLEEIERTPPRIQLEKKDFNNIISRSQAPKKIRLTAKKRFTGREMSLGPSMGNKISII